MALDKKKLKSAFKLAGSINESANNFSNAIIKYLTTVEAGYEPVKIEKPEELIKHKKNLRTGIKKALRMPNTPKNYCTRVQEAIQDYLLDTLPLVYPSESFSTPCISITVALETTLISGMKKVKGKSNAPYINKLCALFDQWFKNIGVNFSADPPGVGKLQ